MVLCLPGDQHYEVTVSSRQQRTVLLFEDITDRVKAEERINFMAHYDALTGLPNRAYLHRAGGGRPRAAPPVEGPGHDHADDHRCRRLQACQRHHGSPDRRPRAGRDLRAAGPGAGRATAWWRAWAATSSSSIAAATSPLDDAVLEPQAILDAFQRAVQPDGRSLLGQRQRSASSSPPSRPTMLDDLMTRPTSRSTRPRPTASSRLRCSTTRWIPTTATGSV